MTDSAPQGLIDAMADLHRAMQPKSAPDQVARNVNLTFCFDGGGAPIAVGAHVYLWTHFPARINGYAVMSDVTGSVTFALTACPETSFPSLVNIVASAPPTMTTARSAVGDVAAVSTWTDVVPRDTVFDATVDSISGDISVLTLSIRAKRLDL